MCVGVVVFFGGTFVLVVLASQKRSFQTDQQHPDALNTLSKQQRNESKRTRARDTKVKAKAQIVDPSKDIRVIATCSECTHKGQVCSQGASASVRIMLHLFHPQPGWISE